MRVWLFLGLLVFLVWTWRKRAPPVTPHATESVPAPKPTNTQAIQACTLCGLHLPSQELIPGKQGAYCCAAHLTQAEG